MIKIKNWFYKNKLSLNLAKTKFMFIAKRKQNDFIEGLRVEKLPDFRFLGVIFDENLSYIEY